MVNAAGAPRTRCSVQSSSPKTPPTGTSRTQGQSLRDVCPLPGGQTSRNLSNHANHGKRSEACGRSDCARQGDRGREVAALWGWRGERSEAAEAGVTAAGSGTYGGSPRRAAEPQRRDRALRGGRRPPGRAMIRQAPQRADGGLRGVVPPGRYSATAPQLSLRRRGHCVASNPLADGGTAWRSAAAQRHNTSLRKPKQVMTIRTLSALFVRTVAAANVTAVTLPGGPKLGAPGTRLEDGEDG